MTDITLFFFRHGQTEWNRNNIIQGAGNDIPLNETGWTQAQKLARQLADSGIEHIYSSDLIRAADTAQVIAETLKVGRTLYPALREINLGAAEGMPRIKAKIKYPQLFHDLDRADAESFATTCLPGGETRQNVFDRVRTCLHTALAESPYKTVAVSTHAGVMHTLVLRIFGVMRPFPNCSILTLVMNAQTGEIKEGETLSANEGWCDEEP